MVKCVYCLLPQAEVTEVAMGLQDELVQDWYINDIDTFNALAFVEFVKQLRACFLPRNWEDTVSTALRRMFQCDSDRLANWIDSVEKQTFSCGTRPFT